MPSVVYLRESSEFTDILAADLEAGPLRRRLPTVTLHLPDGQEIQGTGELVTTTEGWDLLVNPTTAYSYNFFSPGAVSRTQAWRATGQFADPNTFRIKPVWPPHAAQTATGAQSTYQSLTLSVHRLTIPHVSAGSLRTSYRPTRLHASFPDDQFLFAADWVPKREEVPGFGTLETRSREVFRFNFDGVEVAVRNHKRENRFEIRVPGGLLISRRRLAAIQSAFSFLLGYRTLASQVTHANSMGRYSDELNERRPQKRLHHVPFNQGNLNGAAHSVSLLCEFFLHHPLSEQIDSLIYNVQSVAGGSDDGQALLFCAALEGLINTLAEHHNIVDQISSADVGYAEARTLVSGFISHSIEDSNDGPGPITRLAAGLGRISSQMHGRPRLRDLYNALVAHYGLPVNEMNLVFTGWSALRSRRAHGNFGDNGNWVATFTHSGWVAFGVYALILKECGYSGPVWALTLPEQTVTV